MAEERDSVNKPNRKVFIGFLGAGPYTVCNYYFDSVEDREMHVRHVQEAIVRHECKGWTENDRILIFLTEAAKANNWEDGKFDDRDKDDNTKPPIVPGKDKWGLHHQLVKAARGIGNDEDESAAIDKKIFPESIITPVSLDCEGFSETEIWKIFSCINDNINNNDEIYFDFTSGFRSLPMLGMVLLTYLKNTKNVTIGQIYYGAFEKMGTVGMVKNIPIDERNAPVLRLKSFSDIMDFSNAANVFSKYGNSLLLCDMIDRIWVKRSNDSSEFALEMKKMMKPLSTNLERITRMLQTCRGLEIVNGDNVKNIRICIKNIIENDTEKNGPRRALDPILEMIESKFAEFSDSKKLKNGIVAAKWCFDNGMTQQCITIMQEMIVSICMDAIGMDYTCKEDREMIGSTLQWIGGKKNFEATEKHKKTRNDLEQVFSSERMKAVGCAYSSLSEVRNDVNHAGFKLEKSQRTSGRFKVGKEAFKDLSDSFGKNLPLFEELSEFVKEEDDGILKKLNEELSLKAPRISENDKEEILDAWKTIRAKTDFLSMRLQQLQLGNGIMTRPAGLIENECLQYLNVVKDLLK
ncbi:TIGR02221 family CRISPR-associated protein [Fibrobacter sp. UWB12]|uniref:TIGR02221 family CRISPR-associated protein n=1 Tax=Fibrobacter sp. UWB12 TaxID=1896203 RepID=UPI000917EBFC|nr:TIGR02221 family CRISPR-associated protein [Fibrobacter sp. UWB12]SHL00666.1 CRISPR-associated protein, TM1812 family [Fibrobacter sp. UWB12]